MFKFLKKINKSAFKRTLKNLLFVILGNVLLAFGSSIFLIELDIVTGGVSGIGIIIQHFVGDSFQVVDIFVFIATWAFWILGLIFMGKEFAFKTLISTILYPLLLQYQLLYMIQIQQNYKLLCSKNQFHNLILILLHIYPFLKMKLTF